MQNNIVCPNCGNYISTNSIVCPYCGVGISNPNYHPNSVAMNPNSVTRQPIPTTSQISNSHPSTTNNNGPILQPLALAGFLLGILSLIAQLGGVVSSGAIVCSALALNKQIHGKDKALAITGIVLGVISLICFLIFIIYMGNSLNSLVHLMNGLRSNLQQLMNH